MKFNQFLLGCLALTASEMVLAGTVVGRVVGVPVGVPVPWEDGGLLALVAGGLALGIWIVRRKKDK